MQTPCEQAESCLPPAAPSHPAPTSTPSDTPAKFGPPRRHQVSCIGDWFYKPHGEIWKLFVFTTRLQILFCLIFVSFIYYNTFSSSTSYSRVAPNVGPTYHNTRNYYYHPYAKARNPYIQHPPPRQYRSPRHRRQEEAERRMRAKEEQRKRNEEAWNKRELELKRDEERLLQQEKIMEEEYSEHNHPKTNWQEATQWVLAYDTWWYMTLWIITFVLLLHLFVNVFLLYILHDLIFTWVLYAHAGVLGTIMRRAAEGERSAPLRRFLCGMRATSDFPFGLLSLQLLMSALVVYDTGELLHLFWYWKWLYIILCEIWHWILIWGLVVYDTVCFIEIGGILHLMYAFGDIWHWWICYTCFDIEGDFIWFWVRYDTLFL